MKKDFVKEIWVYYRKNKRDLAWRRTTDPYAIVVSEIMLQQTQVSRVTPKYEAFLGRFPDFATLDAASVADVIKEWKGLGYNRRAIGLKRIAEKVMGEFHGKLPADPVVLETFPSIGKATAASISAFIWNMPVVFIETNIRRVFIHFFFREREETVDDKEILPLVAETLPVKRAREWYYALMDYGAMLKSVGQGPNPNRKSAHYRKQAAFEGSNRQVRGAILRYLSDMNEGKTGKTAHSVSETSLVAALGKKLARKPEEITKNLGVLEKEGFLKRDKKKVRLA